MNLSRDNQTVRFDWGRHWVQGWSEIDFPSRGRLFFVQRVLAKVSTRAGYFCAGRWVGRHDLRIDADWKASARSSHIPRLSLTTTSRPRHFSSSPERRTSRQTHQIVDQGRRIFSASCVGVWRPDDFFRSASMFGFTMRLSRNLVETYWAIVSSVSRGSYRGSKLCNHHKCSNGMVSW